MRFHTSLDREQIHAALQRAKQAGKLTEDVEFRELTEYKSRTHERQFEVQLGVSKSHTYVPLPADYVNQYGKKQRTRRTANGDGYNWYAATWHEWGWFIAFLYEAGSHGDRWGSDPDHARYPWGYFSRDDFESKTDWQFDTDLIDDLPPLRPAADPRLVEITAHP